jgi:hypothetical protein
VVHNLLGDSFAQRVRTAYSRGHDAQKEKRLSVPEANSCLAVCEQYKGKLGHQVKLECRNQTFSLGFAQKPSIYNRWLTLQNRAGRRVEAMGRVFSSI